MNATNQPPTQGQVVKQEIDPLTTGSFAIVFDDSMQGKEIRVGFNPGSIQSPAIPSLNGYHPPPIQEAQSGGSKHLDRFTRVSESSAQVAFNHSSTGATPPRIGVMPPQTGVGAMPINKQVIFATTGYSYEDLKAILSTRLNYGYANAPYWIKDIKIEGEIREVVYSNWQDGQTYIRGFTVGENNEVTLSPAQAATARTVYETVQMSNQAYELSNRVIFSDGNLEYVTRSGKIFQIGSFIDGQGLPFEMNATELQAAVAGFSPVPVDLDHHITILSGKLGTLSEVSTTKECDLLFGTVALPKWLDDIVGPDPLKVSTTWDRASKRLTGLALAVNPVIDDAQIVSAFAQFAGKRHSDSDMRDIQSMHDIAVRQGANCSSAKMSTQPTVGGNVNQQEEAGLFARFGAYLQQYFGGGQQQVTTPPQTINPQQGFQPAAPLNNQTQFGQPSPAGQTTQPGFQTVAPPVVQATNQPPDAALLSRAENAEAALKAERLKRIEAEAATFSAQMISTEYARATPAEKAAIEADYRMAATDDINSPVEVQFSNTREESGKIITEEKKGTRVDAMRARYLQRPKLNLTTTRVPGSAAVIFSDTVANVTPGGSTAAGGATQEGQPVTVERKKALMSMTQLGQATQKESTLARNN